MGEEDEELERIRRRKLREMMRRMAAGGGEDIGKTGEVFTLNSSNFDQFIRSTHLPVLVDFWADWCLPCLMMAPVIKELAKDYAGKAIFAKVNVDQNVDLASRFDIMSIPHFILFKDGRPVERVIGAVGRGPLEKLIRKYLT